MGKETGIRWTDHTFNSVWGCAKVSDGCKNCYADASQHRWGMDTFGYNPDGSRKPLRTFGDKHWDEPLRWNRAAGQAGERRRVFANSMGDVFDDHPDAAPERERLWGVIRATPWLDWQLLTKRPERIAGSLPDDWGEGYSNVWLGTTLENDRVYGRLAHLLAVPARVRFLSCEPLVGPVELSTQRVGGAHALDGLDWIIVGGESGSGARRMDPGAARRIIRDCDLFRVPVFFKQTGTVLAREMGLAHSKGENPAEWPTDWQRQDFPVVAR